MTPDQKKSKNAASKQRERARKKQAGLARLELWAPPKLHQQIKTYARNLLNKCTISTEDKNKKLDKD